MIYTVIVTEHAVRQLKKLNRQAIPPLKAAIAELSNNPRPQNYIKLTNVEAYRIRVGNYRIICLN